MNIQDALKSYSPAFIRITNWQNNRWLIWDNDMWVVYESIDTKSFGKIIGMTNDENIAVGILTFGTSERQ